MASLPMLALPIGEPADGERADRERADRDRSDRHSSDGDLAVGSSTSSHRPAPFVQLRIQHTGNVCAGRLSA